MNAEQKQLSIGMLLALILTNVKETSVYNKYKPIFGAYTNWNLIFIFYRYLFNMDAWDQFLCINSVGICVGFRTAFANGLSHNLWSKLRNDGINLSNMQMCVGDHIVHTLPAVIMTLKVLNSGVKIPTVTILYTLIFGSLFAYSQNGKLDSSESYVPHPWKRTWISIITSMLFTQKAVNYAQDKKYGKAIISASGLMLPYTVSKFDKSMKRTYTFEYLIRRHKNFQQRCIRKIRSVATF